MSTITLKNSRANGVSESIQAILRHTMPMKLAIRLSAVKQNVDNKMEQIEEVRRSLVERHGEGDPPTVDQEMDSWQDFVDEYEELVNEEFEIEDPNLVVYVRTNDEDEEEYSFSPKFSSTFNEMNGQIVHNLRGIMEIVDTDEDNEDDDGE